jgi:plasmid stabilization system protein ParE
MKKNCGAASMAKIRRFHPLAAADISKAIAYYDDVSIDLGNRFRDSIRQRFESITEFPESYGKIRDPLRAAMISRFPYVILFEQVDEAVVILGVFHAASDCEGWFERKT